MDTHQSTIADRYELRRRVGSGGSGEVWLADDLELNRRVAVKRVEIPAHMSDDERANARERVLREARAAARIDHPHAVRVYDVLEEEGAVAIVMAYIDAPNLQEIVREQGPLSDHRAAAIGMQILDVLNAAHARGVVHRDVKPSNVLVSDEGVKLTDFGIAAVSDETDLTRTGTALGSPGYMAPEQASGDRVTTAADLWGLGATLFYAVEGKPPFDRGRAVATLHAVVHDDRAQASSSSQLLPVIDRLLSKDPDGRPTVDDARRQLDQVERGADTTVAMDTSELTRTQRLSDDDRGAVTSDQVIGEQDREEEERPDQGRRVGAASVGSTVESHTEREQARSPEWGRGRQRKDHAARRRDQDGDRTGKVMGGVLTAVVVVVLAGLAWFWFGTTGDGEQQPTDAPVAQETQGEQAEPGAAPADEATPPQTTEPADVASPEDSPSPSPTPTETAAAQVPEGWEAFDGPAYVVAHPSGWEPQDASGPRVDITDPDTGSYLRLDYTDEPKDDPVADWERQSDAFAERHENYEEIQIEAVDYRDYDAALWEYTYTEGGQQFHAYNLGFTTGECGYALNLQAPAEVWPQIEQLFDEFKASFQPQGC